MISAVLLVNWDDVRDTAPPPHSTPNPALVAQALLKRAGLRAQVSEAHGYGDWRVDDGLAPPGSLQHVGVPNPPPPAAHPRPESGPNPPRPPSPARTTK